MWGFFFLLFSLGVYFHYIFATTSFAFLGVLSHNEGNRLEVALSNQTNKYIGGLLLGRYDSGLIGSPCIIDDV